jgi:hypothetical protein
MSKTPDKNMYCTMFFPERPASPKIGTGTLPRLALTALFDLAKAHLRRLTHPRTQLIDQT